MSIDVAMRLISLLLSADLASVSSTATFGVWPKSPVEPGFPEKVGAAA